MNRKIYVAGFSNDCGYANWMEITGYAKKIEDADLIVGLGGSDVSGKYYGQPNSQYLGSSHWTDEAEFKDYSKAIELGKKIIGICKGIQFGAALAGGAIFQHVHHPYSHKLITFDGKILNTNSLHHNLVDLSKLKENEDYKILDRK